MTERGRERWEPNPALEREGPAEHDAPAPPACVVDGVTLRAPPRLVGAHVQVLLAAFGLFGASVGLASMAGAPLPAYLLFAALAGTSALLLRAAFRSPPSGTLRIDDGAVYLGARLVMPPGACAAAWLAPAPRGVTLILLRRGRRRRISYLWLRSPEDGRRALAALGTDVDRAAVSIALPSPTHAWPGWIAATSVAFALLAGAVPLPAGLGALGALLLTMLVPGTVAIGSDGVLLRWLVFRRFVSHARLQSIESTTPGLRLAVREERPLVLRTRWPSEGRFDDPTEAIAARLDQVRAGRERGGVLDDAVLARHGAPVRDWIAALRSLPGGGTFRAQQVPPTQLWRRVDDVVASPEQRAAAAIALSTSLGDEGRRRLRLVASSCVDPRLRSALLAAASGDELALEASVARLGERTSRQRPRA